MDNKTHTVEVEKLALIQILGINRNKIYRWINENSVANPDLNHRILLFLASFNYEPLKSVQHKHRK